MNVSFAYRDQKVIDNISFEVTKGEVVALVGHSGSGKSTIFKLILKFYPVNSGNITIDGTDVGEQSIEAVRNKISYVPQDAYLSSGTITDNIRYGKDGVSREDIIEEAKAANAHDFIMGL